MNDGDGRCLEAHNALPEKGEANPGAGRSSAPADPSVGTGGDSSAPGSEPKNAKQNAKRAFADPGLARVIDAWPSLPEPTKAAVLALVQTASETQGKSARRRKE